MIKKSKKFLLLIIIVLASLFLFLYKLDQVPPCLNADEAAFSYNSYSLLKTGKDEFGNFLPLRLISFGDYKMPLLTYINIPFIYLFGLDLIKIKYVNGLIMISLVFIIYFLTKNLFSEEKIAFVSSFFIATNWALISLSRQLHEALLSVFLICLTWLLFLKSIKNKNSQLYLFLYIFVFFISLFSYQTNRLFGLFFFLISLIFYIRKKLPAKVFLISLIFFILFLISDFIYKPQRVKNLFFTNNIGFKLKIDQLRNEGGERFFYNKLTLGVNEFISNYLVYFSPQFLILEGDTNRRFGSTSLSPINLVEYILFFIGLYYLFKNKEKHRFFIIGLLLISPIPAALSWAGISLTRSLFIIIPILITSSYGLINLLTNLKNTYLKKVILFLIFFSYLYFSFYVWDFYFNHYPKKLETKQAWQCGYKELVLYIKNNYENFDKFYISKTSGPPYIFFLFFLKYPPEKFQPRAKLGKIDEYGFQQVESFDKFYFNLDYHQDKNKIVVVGRPYEIPEEGAKKIIIDNLDFFWIKEFK